MIRKFITLVSMLALVVTLIATLGVHEASAASKNKVDRVISVEVNIDLTDPNQYTGQIPNLIIEVDDKSVGDDVYAWVDSEIFRLELPSSASWEFAEYKYKVTNASVSLLTEQIVEVRTDSGLYQGEVVVIPMRVKWKSDAIGEQRVTVVPLDSRVTGGSYTFAVVTNGRTFASLSKKPMHLLDVDSISLDNAPKLYIDESYPGLLNNGDFFRVILPTGVRWNTDVINYIVNGKGTIVTDQLLQIEIQAEENRRTSIEIPLLVDIDGFAGELQAHIVPAGSKVTEESITFAYVAETLSINDTITFPKAKAKLSNFRYGYSEEKGYKLARVDIETWVEEEPPNKIDWYVHDFITKWMLNDGREILGDYQIEGSTVAKVNQWNKSTIVFRMKDYQEVTGIYIVDPLDRNHVVKVHWEGTGQDKPIDKTPSTGSRVGGGGSIIPSNEQTVPAGNNNTIKLKEVTITIPANSLNEDARIKVVKVSNTSNLPVPRHMYLAGDVYEITKDIKGNFDHNITITLPFNKSEYDTFRYDLGVYWFNEETSEWMPLDNIQIELENGTVSGEVNHFAKFAVFAVEKEETMVEEIIEEAVEEDITVNISDIAGHWAEEGINTLINLGAIKGYADGTFKPNNSITRAEFVSMLVKVFKLEYVNGKVFDDTLNHWAKDAIATAQAHGIVSGYNEDIFGSDDLITREQMAGMIIKVLDLEHKESSKTYVDEYDISDWALDSLIIAVENGIMSGYPDHTLRPQNNATRAEAVTVIVRAIIEMSR